MNKRQRKKRLKKQLEGVREAIGNLMSGVDLKKIIYSPTVFDWIPKGK